MISELRSRAAPILYSFATTAIAKNPRPNRNIQLPTWNHHLLRWYHLYTWPTYAFDSTYKGRTVTTCDDCIYGTSAGVAYKSYSSPHHHGIYALRICCDNMDGCAIIPGRSFSPSSPQRRSGFEFRWVGTFRLSMLFRPS